jgi:hypothetical protein
MAIPAAPVGTDSTAGRWVQVRGREGFFRAGRDEAGRWWLLDPAGQALFLRAVHGVRLAETPEDRGPARDSAAQLRGWGFNALGLADGAVYDDGLPFLAAVDFCAAGSVLQAPGLRLPDVFDPDWAGAVRARAGAWCPLLAGQAALIGWITDSDLAWAQAGATPCPTLLQLCLSLEPRFAAYHAAWEFVLALHGGRLEALARAWGVSLPNREVLREMTRHEAGLATRGYGRDQARWTREFARRYFSTTAAAVRAADPNHLVLGCPLERGAGAEVRAEGVYPAVDVTLPDWRDLPAAATAQPFLAGGVGWAEAEFQTAPATRRAVRSTAVERMLRRARAGLERLAGHPAAVGYVWARWQDGPGEQPPFARGLVHVDGAEAREHTELLAQFNARAERLHAAATGGSRSQS